MSAALALPASSFSGSEITEQWLPRDRFLSLARRSDRWLHAQQQLGSVVTRQTERTLRNGRAEIEVAVSSLPAEAYARYEAEQRRRIPPPPGTLDLFAAPHLAIAQPCRIALPSSRRSEADARMDILQAVLAYRNHVRSGYVGSAGLQLADGRPVNSLDRMVAYAAEQSADGPFPASVRTIYRWLDRYDRGGLSELATRKRADADQSRWWRGTGRARPGRRP